MCSLKSLHCLLDAVRFSAVCFAHSAKDVSNLSHSVWSRSFFNLFPSPFFCVTNFYAVYLELSANEWTSARARVHFIALPALNSSLFSRALILVCSCGCCCCWLGSALSSLFFLPSAQCTAWRFTRVCVCFSFIFGFSFWSELAEHWALLSIPIVLFDYELPIENLIKSVRLESRETM